MAEYIIQVRLHGTLEEFDELRNALAAVQEIESIRVLSQETIRRSLLARQPHRQTGLLDILIAVVINLGTAAAYERIRNRLQQEAQKRNAKIISVSEPEENDAAKKPVKEPSPRPKPKANEKRNRKKTRRRRTLKRRSR